jgi:hypothetical protein
MGLHREAGPGHERRDAGAPQQAENAQGSNVTRGMPIAGRLGS